MYLITIDTFCQHNFLSLKFQVFKRYDEICYIFILLNFRLKICNLYTFLVKSTILFGLSLNTKVFIVYQLVCLKCFSYVHFIM